MLWLSVSALAGLGSPSRPLILALPWIIGLPWAQRQLSLQANRLLAPGGVGFDHVRVSWSRPTEIDGLVLRDPQGDDIVTAPRAHFSLSLWDIVLTSTRPRPRSPWRRPSVDIERSGDGKVDLLETLKPILSDRPRHTLLIRIADGKLRFQPGGTRPADRGRPGRHQPRPECLSSAGRLEHEACAVPPGTRAEGTVQLEGKMSHDKGPTGAPLELDLSIRGDRWPWEFANPSVAGPRGLQRHPRRPRQGRTSLARRGRQDPRSPGDGQGTHGRHAEARRGVGGLEGRPGRGRTGPPIGWTSRPRWGRSRPGGPSRPPAATRRTSKAISTSPPWPGKSPGPSACATTFSLEKGSVQLTADIKGDASGGGQSIRATAKLADLAASRAGQTLTFRDPATLIARLNRKAESLELEQLDVQTPFLNASGSRRPRPRDQRHRDVRPQGGSGSAPRLGRPRQGASSPARASSRPATGGSSTGSRPAATPSSRG